MEHSKSEIKESIKALKASVKNDRGRWAMLTNSDLSEAECKKQVIKKITKLLGHSDFRIRAISPMEGTVEVEMLAGDL